MLLCREDDVLVASSRTVLYILDMLQAAFVYMGCCIRLERFGVFCIYMAFYHINYIWFL
jgi:hypothetical protein